MKTPKEILHLLTPICEKIEVEKVLVSIDQWSDSLIARVSVTLYSKAMTPDGENVFSIGASTPYDDFDFRALELKLAAEYLEITGKYIMS